MCTDEYWSIDSPEIFVCPEERIVIQFSSATVAGLSRQIGIYVEYARPGRRHVRNIHQHQYFLIISIDSMIFFHSYRVLWLFTISMK